MADLVDKFFAADLSPQEEEALDALLGSSPEAANRFADRAAEAYALFGLPDAGSGAVSGSRAWVWWLGGLLALLTAAGTVEWRHLKMAKGEGALPKPTAQLSGALSGPKTTILASRPAASGETEPPMATQGKAHARLKITVQVSQAGPVSVVVLNAAGSAIKAIFNGNLAPGSYDFYWDGRTDNGQAAPPGSYRIETHSGSTIQTQYFSIENKGK